MLLDAASELAPGGKRRRKGRISDLARWAPGGRKAREIEIEGDWTGPTREAT